MDELHACYRSVGRWGPGPSDTFTMRWYRAATGAKTYPFFHAFGTTVDAGTYNDSPGMVGEIPPTWREWSPSGPPLYDGSDEPVYNPALEWGADPLVMNTPCDDGSITLVGSATTGFAPIVVFGGNCCECQTQRGGIALVF